MNIELIQVVGAMDWERAHLLLRSWMRYGTPPVIGGIIDFGCEVGELQVVEDAVRAAPPGSTFTLGGTPVAGAKAAELWRHPNPAGRGHIREVEVTFA